MWIAACVVKPYNEVIRSFAHKGLEKFFLNGSKAGIQTSHAEKLARQLTILNVAKAPEEMDKPGW